MNHFKPILCGRCGTVVWSGLSSSGFPTVLDIKQLTIEEEIIKKVSGLMTYEAHKTSVSFEVTARILSRIKMARPKPDRVILAAHECSDYNLFGAIENAPNYWQAPVNEKVTTTLNAEGFPF